MATVYPGSLCGCAKVCSQQDCVAHRPKDPSGTTYFNDGNNDWPAVQGSFVDNALPPSQGRQDASGLDDWTQCQIQSRSGLQALLKTGFIIPNKQPPVNNSKPPGVSSTPSSPDGSPQTQQPEQQQQQQTSNRAELTSSTSATPSPTSASSNQQSDPNGDPSNPGNIPQPITNRFTVTSSPGDGGNVVRNGGRDGSNPLSSQNLAALLSGIGLASLVAGSGFFVWNRMRRRLLADPKHVVQAHQQHYAAERQEPRRTSSEESQARTQVQHEAEETVDNHDSEGEVVGPGVDVLSPVELEVEGRIISGERPPPYARRWGILSDTPPEYPQNDHGR
ncbi:hypothetical protein HDU97_007024 [Phlyctochytrium planicorne]|nr:hypothetical protein HDU97_007024 [Phlyctochytrium planicorne]